MSKIKGMLSKRTINPANFSGLIMENISQWVGIDISKATLDVYLRPMGKAMKVANTKEDISKLVETLKSYTVNLIVLEATGGLETELVIQLQAAGLPGALINRLVGRGKSKKLALTACVRKILVILNAMVRQNQPWQLADNLQPCS